MIEVATQAQLDKALAKTNNGADELIVCVGGGRFVARGNSSVVARGNSSVVAWENSSVEARGNSSVEARGNSSVVAWENSFTRAFGYGSVKAGSHAIVMRHSAENKISGGQILEAHKPKTGQEWCDFYGVTVEDGVAILFKAVGASFATRNGVAYVPGTEPSAPDWDGGKAECGGGLHFSPHPKMAREFNRGAKHFVACPVRVEDIAVHPDGSMPEKIKAPRCAAAVWEVDVKGVRI